MIVNYYKTKDGNVVATLKTPTGEIQRMLAYSISTILFCLEEQFGHAAFTFKEVQCDSQELNRA